MEFIGYYFGLINYEMGRIYLFFLYCLMVFVSCSSRTDKKAEGAITTSTPVSNDLPKIVLTDLGGKQLTGESLLGRAVILILFQPDCDHCQREAKELKEHIQSFNSYQLYFISASPADQVRKFAADYKLSDEHNISFVLTDVQSILDSFGPIPAPSLYIYNAAGKLVQKFNGETDMNLILKAL